MANFLQSLMQLFSQPPAQVVAQDRYMRTPIVQEQQYPGVGATYDAGNDRISVGDLNNLHPDDISHEVTHRIYNKAGLKKLAPELLPNLSNITKNYLLSSPTYQSLSGAGSPEQLTNEGLAYSATSPVMGDKDFVNTAAQAIQNQNLKNTLLRVFQNRQNAKSIE